MINQQSQDMGEDERISFMEIASCHSKARLHQYKDSTPEQLKTFLTSEDALRIASKHHLEAEVKSAMNSGMSPFEACIEWDLI